MVIEPNRDIDLGTLLLDKKLITPGQLIKSTELQKVKGGYLSQHLIDLGFIKDEELTTYLTCYFGFSYLPLKSYNISEKALKYIPPSYCLDFCVIPIEINDRLLSLTMADPLNKGVLQLLRQTSGCEIIIFISTRKEIKEAIEKYFSTPFRNFEMDKFQHDPFLRDNLNNNFVWHGTYTGPNRRRYKRFSLDLMAECYVYPYAFKTKVMDVSMSGLQFQTNSSLPSGLQLPIKLQLEKDKLINCVVEIVRSEKKNIVTPHTVKTHQDLNEVGAFFNFVTEKDQTLLADFLRQRAMAAL